MLLALFIIAGSVLLDQWVKSWAVGTLQSVGTIPLIDGVFHLTYAENTGAAFSLLRGGRWLFVCVTVAILIAIVILLCRGFVRHFLGKISLYMVIGGAIGNLIDRVLHGYVVDMLDFRLIQFAIFNVADCFVTVGGVLFAMYILFLHDKKESSKEEMNHGA